MTLSARWLSKRLLLTVLSAYLVMSLAFGLVAFTPDPGEGQVAYQTARQTGGNETAVENALEDYREARNRDEPIEQRYVNYLGNTVTFSWGVSFSQGQPVSTLIADRLPATARYVLFGLVLSTLGGLALGAYGALAHRSIGDRAVSIVVYGLFGLANFYVAEVILRETELLYFREPNAGPLAFLPDWLAGASPTAEVVVPGTILATTLLAGQLRYARAASLEYVDQEFVKMLRSKGAGPLRVGRHVVRNAAVPLLSLFFSELFAVLVLEAIVLERIFRIPGLMALTLTAVQRRDLPLVVGIALTVALVGVLANLFQDVTYRALDPRVE